MASRRCKVCAGGESGGAGESVCESGKWQVGRMRRAGWPGRPNIDGRLKLRKLDRAIRQILIAYGWQMPEPMRVE